MKKLLISLSAIVMLVAGATVASAAGGYIVDYNEDLSVAGETAVVDIYLDVPGPEGFTSLACQIALYDGSTNVMKDYVSSASCTPYGGLTASQVKYQSTQGLLMVTGAGSVTTPLVVADDGHLGRFTLTLKQELKDGLVFSRLASRDTTYNVVTDGVAGPKVITNDFNEYATITVAPAGPTTATTNATLVPNATAEEGETYIEKSDAAVAYWAEGYFTQGKSSAYWTATINTVPKKKDVAVPNITGNAKLGIVIVGATSVEAVKLNVVTQ